MSQFTGRQHRGAMRDRRDVKRHEAQERQARHDAFVLEQQQLRGVDHASARRIGRNLKRWRHRQRENVVSAIYSTF